MANNYSDKRIIYPNDEGGVSIVIPSPNCELTLDQVIDKSVPQGKPYQVLEVSEIPTDRSYRNAWNYVEEA
jgi:hypothetical protein